jgi:hypothetical protein
MQNGTLIRVVALSLVTGFVSAASLQAAPATPAAAQDCTVRVEQPIEVREGAQEIKAVVSAELPAEVTAAFPEDSNLKASDAQKAPEEKTVVVKVDASKAQPGAYELSLKAGELTCKGEVTVEAAKQ